MSSLYQLWRFENVLETGQSHDGFDRLYVPQMSYVTGDIDVHDIALDAAGEPVFVNTLFSCLARPSATHSFAPVWHPRFVTRLAAEDRCHLNGLAMRDGRPAYVTLVGRSDVVGYRAPAAGWYYVQVKLTTPGWGSYRLLVSKSRARAARVSTTCPSLGPVRL